MCCYPYIAFFFYLCRYVDVIGTIQWFVTLYVVWYKAGVVWYNAGGLVGCPMEWSGIKEVLGYWGPAECGPCQCPNQYRDNNRSMQIWHIQVHLDNYMSI